MIIDSDYKPKNGWTLAIIDLDLMTKEEWKKLPAIYVYKLRALNNMEEYPRVEQLREMGKDIESFIKES